MKRKFVLIFSLFFFACLIFNSASFALEQTSKAGVAKPDFIPPPDGQPTGFFGQDHYYTVTFRGNGEAVVTAKLIFTNLGDKTLTEMALRIPKAYPQEISVYQVIRERGCIRYYSPPSIQPDIDERPLIYPPISPTPICQEWQEPDYYGYFYGGKYQKAQWELRGDTIVVDLPEDLRPNDSTSIVLYYRAFGYAKKTIFGAYKYSFETLKVEDKIRHLSVAINVDADLFLKGAKGKINYRFEESFAPLKSIGVDQPVSSVQFDTLYQQIGQGQMIKTASNLSPLESYTVKGSFADSRLKLYGWQILIGLLVVWFLAAFVVFFAKLMINRWKTREITSKKKTIRGLNLDWMSKGAGPFFVVLGASFLSSFLILIYTLFLFFVGRLLTSVYYYQFGTIILILLIIISVGIYALLLFGPAIFIWIKKGSGWGILSFFLTIAWLVFYLVVVFLILFILSARYPGPIVPMLEKSG